MNLPALSAELREMRSVAPRVREMTRLGVTTVPIDTVQDYADMLELAADVLDRVLPQVADLAARVTALESERDRWKIRAQAGGL